MDIQQISDQLEIERLLHTYARAVDTHDWDLWRSVFTDDASIDYTSTPHGEKGTRDEVAAWLEQNFSIIPMAMHLITNIEADVDGDTATVRALFHNPIQLPGVEGISFCGGVYHHQLVRTPDGWRSRSLVEECVWFQNNPFA